MRTKTCMFCGVQMVKIPDISNQRWEAKQCCSTKCSGKARSNKPIETRVGWTGLLASQVKYRAKGRGIPFYLGRDDIRWMFRLQDGRCAITNMQMYPVSVIGCREEFRKLRSMYKVSVDRIDSSKGYTRDNVQLVVMGANYMALDFDKDDVELFVQKIVEARKELKDDRTL